MSLTPAMWLSKRSGSLKLGSDGATWFVCLGGAPLYSLRPVPVKGGIGCAIRQTHNGQIITGTAAFATKDEALQAGLERLREQLGWG